MSGFKLLNVLLILIAFNVKANTGCSLAFPPLPESSAEPELLIFVSFNMPEQSLRGWAEEANRVNGTLLFRGFLENDLTKTVAKTRVIFGENIKTEIAVDPERFQTFKVQAVPAVVVALPEQDVEHHGLSPTFDIVYGDTSLEEALKRIAATGSPERQKTAQHFLKRYRTSHE